MIRTIRRWTILVKKGESFVTVALKRLDDLEGAEEVLEKAHALSPQDPLVLINYAIILEALGKRSIAVELLTALNDITAVIEVDAQVMLLRDRENGSCFVLISFPLPFVCYRRLRRLQRNWQRNFIRKERAANRRRSRGYLTPTKFETRHPLLRIKKFRLRNFFNAC